MPARPIRAFAVIVFSAVVAVSGWLTPLRAEAAPKLTLTPQLTVTRVVGNLSIPWDVTWVGSLMLFDQRAGSVWSKRGSAAPKKVSMPLPKVFATGEAGLLGLVADPKAASNKYFYTCVATATAATGIP